MITEITTPTLVTEEQYKKGYFAINRENADHWFINEQDNIRVFVGNYPESLSNSYSAMMEGKLNAEINGVTVIDGNGKEIEIEAITYGSEHAWNDLNLIALSHGRIEWE